ncbi:adenylosuccinate lyase [Nocardia nepalensis]|uniref:adenylosuccinate lyase n=1 Tax=Nocardia nepalensis TaxID=3375448 RepID=UPI003B673651
MIARFSTPEMTALWSEQNRYDTWTRVEVLAAEAQAELGHVPAAALADIRRALAPLAARVAELERDREHEVLSFLAAYCEPMPEDSARWVHLGMTSYDLVDTALGCTLAQATDLVLDAARRLCRVLVDRAIEHWDTVCIGRTHGVHAEPTTFGHKLAGFAFGIDRSIRRVAAARAAVAVGTISGAVGTYALIDPFVEEYVCRALDLGIEPVPTQVVARDRHAELAVAIATLGVCIESIALEFRLLQRTEVREVEECRTGAYQGSSAMPHKRNPTKSERICGLARLLRGAVGPMLENVALWHERDLAHAAVERVALPELLTVGHYMATLTTDLVATLDVATERMRDTVAGSRGLAFSSVVLARLLERGVEREQAYRAVQAAAADAVRSGTDFRKVLASNGIDVEELDAELFLTNHHVIRRRLEALAEPKE